jgi:pimeloyl-ACP methyl ester carboxylesterase
MAEIMPGGGTGSEVRPGRQEAESLPQLDGVRHSFVELAGLRMHVAEAGDGEPLVLLHGFPQHWWAWRKMIPALAEQYRVICPDLRGAGWTDAPPDGYTSDRLLADVVELLDELRLDRVSLIGYDWGGILAYRLCLNHPDRVRRLVTITAPHPYPVVHPRALLSLWRLWPMFATAAPGLGPWLLRSGRQRLPRWMMTGDTDDPSVWTSTDLDIFLSRLRDPARARAGSALYRDFILAEARRSVAGAYRGRRLRTPTLSLYGTVLYGNDDPSREHPEDLDGYQDQADDFTMQHIPGAGFYIAEEQSDAVVAHALTFLAVGDGSERI